MKKATAFRIEDKLYYFLFFIKNQTINKAIPIMRIPTLLLADPIFPIAKGCKTSIAPKIVKPIPAITSNDFIDKC